jgi:hypothetical protein
MTRGALSLAHQHTHFEYLRKELEVQEGGALVSLQLLTKRSIHGHLHDTVTHTCRRKELEGGAGTASSRCGVTRAEKAQGTSNTSHRSQLPPWAQTVQPVFFPVTTTCYVSCHV